MRAFLMPTVANMSRVAQLALRGDGPAQRFCGGGSTSPFLLFIVENAKAANLRLSMGKDNKGAKREVKVAPKIPQGKLVECTIDRGPFVLK